MRKSKRNGRGADDKGMRTIKVYASYNFLDKDPIIDKLRTVVENSGAKYSNIHEDSGVSTTTLYNWFEGQTKRPQFATVAAVARALGQDVGFVRLPREEKARIHEDIERAKKEREKLKRAEERASK